MKKNLIALLLSMVPISAFASTDYDCWAIMYTYGRGSSTEYLNYVAVKIAVGEQKFFPAQIPNQNVFKNDGSGVEISLSDLGRDTLAGFDFYPPTAETGVNERIPTHGLQIRGSRGTSLSAVSTVYGRSAQFQIEVTCTPVEAQ